MIISASRRTDIPSHYSEWFFRRLEAGYVCTRNPMNPHQISRVSLSPDVVDGFVFWTKNPTPMLGKLSRLEGIPYYFQFTLTSYGRDMEANLPSKNDVLVPAFQSLSRQIGPERTIWRYDPIILTPKYTVDYHVHYSVCTTPAATAANTAAPTILPPPSVRTSNPTIPPLPCYAAPSPLRIPSGTERWRSARKRKWA